MKALPADLPWRFSMAVQVKRHEKRPRIADLEYSDWSEHSRPIHFWKALAASLNMIGKRQCGEQYHSLGSSALPGRRQS